VSRILLLVGLLLCGTGLFLLWPLVYQVWRCERVWGQILAVFPQPLPDGRVRLSVVYDFPVPNQAGRTIILGHTQASLSTMQPVDDPVVEADQAEGLERSFMTARSRRVFFLPNDPAATAFILSEAAPGPALGGIHGLAMFFLGLTMWNLSYVLRRKRSRRQPGH
jgi:hypothetical protein